METVKRRLLITTTLLVLMSVTIFAPSSLFSNANNDDEIENAYNGPVYLTNYTFNTMSIDGHVVTGPTEWDAKNYTLSDPNNDAFAYFQWDYDSLYFGFLYSDEAQSFGDNVTLYLDVDGDEVRTNNRDICIILNGINQVYYGIWKSGISNYENVSALPTGFEKAVGFNSSELGYMHYEMQIPMSNISNPYSGNIGFTVGAQDYDTGEWVMDKPAGTIADWNDLIFNHDAPFLWGPLINNRGGFNDSTRFVFSSDYYSAINRPPISVILNITSDSDPSITTEIQMNELIPSDQNYLDGKGYVVDQKLTFPEGWYSYYAYSVDGKMNTTTSKNKIYLFEKENNFGLFDGLGYTYDFSGFFGLIDATFTDNFVDMGAGNWMISGDTTYPGAGVNSRFMETPERNSTILSGTYPFDNNTHEWSFVPTDLEVGDSLNISVIDQGDMNFTVVSINMIRWNGNSYFAYRLENGSSYIYYEQQTGLMLEGNFDLAGLAGDYTLDLSTTNAFDNLLKPVLTDVIIAPKDLSDPVVNSTVDFNCTYYDFDNRTSEALSVTISNGTDTFGTFDLSLDPVIGTTREEGVHYSTSLILWNTSFAESIKNYTSTITAIDGRFIVNSQLAAPNVSYINKYAPNLFDGGSKPWLVANNGTAISFNVTYNDTDNNFPSVVRLHINYSTGMFEMTPNDPSNRDYMGGINYTYTIPAIDQPGLYEYNFSLVDQEGNPINTTSKYLYVVDAPPEINLVKPKGGFQVGNDFTVEITSPSTDVDEIWYNITDATGTVLIHNSYTLGVPQELDDTLPPGIYNITAYLNDTGAGTVVSERHEITLTQDPYFDILLVDMDNSTLETLYVDALKDIGFRQGRDFNVTNYFPTTLDLVGYEVMILATGASEYDWSVNDSVLCDFVNGGGNVYISGQNYYDNGLTNFMENFTGVINSNPLASETGITGISGNPVSDGLSIFLNDIAGYDNYTSGQQKSNELTVSGVDVLFENGGSYPLGIMNATGNGRILVTSFEFARVLEKTLLMERIVYWLVNSSSVTIESPTQGFYRTEGIWLNITTADPSLDTVQYSIWNATGGFWVNQNTTIPSFSDNWIPLSEGDFTIYVSTNNTWGFRAPVDYSQSFRCDITPPTVFIISPLNTTYIEDQTPFITFLADSSASDIATINTSLYSWDFHGFAWEDQEWMPGVPVDFPIGEGYFAFIAYGIDESGNAGPIVTVNFTVEFCPDVTIVKPNLGLYNVSEVPVNITATSNDGVSVIYYDIQNRSSGQMLYEDLIYDNTDPLTYTMPTLPDGIYRIWAYANDSEDYASLSDNWWDFEIDTTAPSLSIYTDLSDSNVNWINDNQMEVYYWSFDARLDTLWYSIYYSDGATWITTGNVTYDGDFYGLPTDTYTNLLDGDYVVFLYGNDTLGNEAEVIRYFVIDTQAPEFDQLIISTNDINTPIDMNLFGIDDTSLGTATLYYNATGISGTQSVSMTKRNTWEFNATIPAFSYNTNVTYWFSLADGFGQTNISVVDSFLIRGLASDGDYIFDYTEELKVDFVFNVSVAGDMNIEFFDNNPEGAALQGVEDILSYISIEFSGTMQSAQLRFYYQFGVEFEDVRLYHYDDGTWKEVSLTESADGSYVYADLESFSTYALIQVAGGPDLFSPLALGLVIGLAVAFAVAMILFMRTRQRYVEEVGIKQSKKLGKGKDTDYSSYDTDYPEKAPYETVDQRAKMKRAQKAEEKRKRLEAKAGGVESSSETVSPTKTRPRPTIVTKSEVLGKGAGADADKVEYYCETCKENHLADLDLENPHQDCPDCGNPMGIKVTCAECGASFQVKPEQYTALIKQKTPCPKCNSPLA